MKTFAALLASGPLLAAAAALAQNANTQSAAAPAYSSNNDVPGTTQVEEAAAQTTLNNAGANPYPSDVDGDAATKQGNQGPAIPTTSSAAAAAGYESDVNAGASSVAGTQQSDLYPGTTTTNLPGQQTTCTDSWGNAFTTHQPVPYGPPGGDSIPATDISGTKWIPITMCGECAHHGKQGGQHHAQPTSNWAPPPYGGRGDHDQDSGQHSANGQDTGPTGGQDGGAGAQSTTATTANEGQPTDNYGDGPGPTDNDGASTTSTQSGATTLQTTSVKPTSSNNAQPTGSYNDDSATGTAGDVADAGSTATPANVRIVLSANGDGERKFEVPTDNTLTPVPDGGVIASEMAVSVVEENVDGDVPAENGRVAAQTYAETTAGVTCIAFSDAEGTEKLGGAVKMGGSGDVTRDGLGGEEVKVRAVKCGRALDAVETMLGIGEGGDGGEEGGEGQEGGEDQEGGEGQEGDTGEENGEGEGGGEEEEDPEN